MLYGMREREANRLLCALVVCGRGRDKKGVTQVTALDITGSGPVPRPLHQHGADHHLLTVDRPAGQLQWAGHPESTGPGSHGPASSLQTWGRNGGMGSTLGPGVPHSIRPKSPSHSPCWQSVPVLVRCPTRGHDPGWLWPSLSAPQCGHSDRCLAA